MLIKFQSNPNQLVLDSINPTDGTLLGKQTVAMKLVTGDFYSIPTVIGWQDNLVYLSLDSKFYVWILSPAKCFFITDYQGSLGIAVAMR